MHQSRSFNPFRNADAAAQAWGGQPSQYPHPGPFSSPQTPSPNAPPVIPARPQRQLPTFDIPPGHSLPSLPVPYAPTYAPPRTAAPVYASAFDPRPHLPPPYPPSAFAPPPPVAQSHPTAAHSAPGDFHSSVSGFVADIGPVPKVSSLSTTAWTDSGKLSLESGNWLPWAQKLSGQLGLVAGLWRFISPDCPPPSFHMYPAHHRAWVDQDMVVRSYISEIIASTERPFLSACTTALEMYETLRVRHTQRGPVGQIDALKKFLSVKYPVDASSFASTSSVLSDLNAAIWAGGPPDPQSFLLAGMLVALSANHGEFVDSLLVLPDLSLSVLLQRMGIKQAYRSGGASGGNGMTFIASNGESIGSFAGSATDSANAARMQPQAKIHRDNCTTPGCPRPNTHTWAYCTAPGGAMAGRKVSEAQAKRRADVAEKATKPQTGGQIKVTHGGAAYATIHGENWLLTPMSTPPAPASVPLPSVDANPSANFASLRTDDLPEPEAWLASVDPVVSLDWREFTVNTVKRCTGVRP